MVIGRVDSLILGYGLFRVASDVEKLPFPMAPISPWACWLSPKMPAARVWRWRCFSLASAIGMAFAVYIAVPTLSGTFLSEPFQILPIRGLIRQQTPRPVTGGGYRYQL